MKTSKNKYDCDFEVMDTRRRGRGFVGVIFATNPTNKTYPYIAVDVTYQQARELIAMLQQIAPERRERREERRQGADRRKDT